MQKVIKNTLVRVLRSVIYDTSQISDVYAKDVNGSSSGVDIFFELEVRLAGIVPRGATIDRRLDASDFNGTASDVVTSLNSDMTSAVTSGNLSTVLSSEAAKTNAIAAGNYPQLF